MHFQNGLEAVASHPWEISETFIQRPEIKITVSVPSSEGHGLRLPQRSSAAEGTATTWHVYLSDSEKSIDSGPLVLTA